MGRKGADESPQSQGSSLGAGLRVPRGGAGEAWAPGKRPSNSDTPSLQGTPHLFQSVFGHELLIPRDSPLRIRLE